MAVYTKIARKLSPWQAFEVWPPMGLFHSPIGLYIISCPMGARAEIKPRFHKMGLKNRGRKNVS
jgi:hypothetical protein